MRNRTLKEYPSVKLIAYLSVTISVLIHVAMFLSFKFGEGIIFQQIGDIAEHKKAHFHIDGFVLNILFTFVLAFALYIIICIYIKMLNLRITLNLSLLS